MTLFIFSCSSAVAVVSVKIYIPDSETGYSGVIFSDDSYEYTLGSPTLNGLLQSLEDEGKIDYDFDGNIVTINGFEFFDALDNSYSRAWIAKINNAIPENGFYSTIADGDVINITYTTFIH
jgi:hypothetical protein